jgi:hypothetical protein
MASKLAVYDTGYEDERFEQIVSQGFHCIICTSVLKDAVMCPENEHLFCRACITKHLMNFQTCPTCMEPLTVETLSQASRGVRILLAELRIRCEFFNRGCGKFIELGDLERHVTECGFAPAVCSNEGCELEVNKQDLLHHETAVCELRRVKCHNCDDIRQEMDTVKVNLALMNEKLDRNEKRLLETLEKIETNGNAVENVVREVELIRQQFNKQDDNNRHVQGDIVEMKKSLTKITKLLERMSQQTSHEVQAEQEQKKTGIAEADDETDRTKEAVCILEGKEDGYLKSEEMCSFVNTEQTEGEESAPTNDSYVFHIRTSSSESEKSTAYHDTTSTLSLETSHEVSDMPMAIQEQTSYSLEKAPLSKFSAKARKERKKALKLYKGRNG